MCVCVRLENKKKKKRERGQPGTAPNQIERHTQRQSLMCPFSPLHRGSTGTSQAAGKQRELGKKKRKNSRLFFILFFFPFLFFLGSGVGRGVRFYGRRRYWHLARFLFSTLVCFSIVIANFSLCALPSPLPLLFLHRDLVCIARGHWVLIP